VEMKEIKFDSTSEVEIYRPAFLAGVHHTYHYQQQSQPSASHIITNQ
jgi:hypothetical protein